MSGAAINDVTILVAEDDADDRFLLQTAFAEKGLPNSLQFVENGVEALDYLLALPCPTKYPNLILLDLNMPKKDGREFLNDLKQSHPEFIKIPVIILSTTHNEVEMNSCYALGADSYIVKPDSYEKLLHIVAGIHSKWIAPTMVTI